MLLSFIFSFLIKEFILSILLLVIFVKARLGYVSLPKTLSITSSKTITYTHYQAMDSKLQKAHLTSLVEQNLEALFEILKYNVKNQIHFYRLTSNLIPLATLETVPFDYITPFRKQYQAIGNYILENHLRVDMHPDQYCVLNSSQPKVVKGAFTILDYHARILDAMNLPDAKLILHVGSSQGGKKRSISRFIHNFQKLPSSIQKRIILENDDKVYTVTDVLALCKALNVPMVLDYHHFLCHNNKELISDFYPAIFATWEKEKLPPKVHFSSPKNRTKKDFRSHHDYIQVDDFICFLEEVKSYTSTLDVMIEAKQKDVALFQLIRELKYKTDYRFIDETTFIVP